LSATKRRAVVLVSPQFVIEAMKEGGPRRFIVERSGLPIDARVVDVLYINSKQMVAVELESQAFEEVPEKGKPPVLAIPVCWVVEPEAEPAVDNVGD
jgi:hypothetical protein